MERLDLELVRRKLVRSRSQAQDFIKRGYVFLNGSEANTQSELVNAEDVLEVKKKERFASRSGEKLDHALSAFGIDLTDKVVLDVGSSTGGFTDCALRRGATKVFAVDIGTEQLHKDLRSDMRVVSMEKTDVRKIDRLDPIPDFAAIDVSFISIKEVLPHVFRLLSPSGSAVALVKPQFEVGKILARKSRGVIRDADAHAHVLEEVKESSILAGFHILGEANSPIDGRAGNKEFLLFLKKQESR